MADVQIKGTGVNSRGVTVSERGRMDVSSRSNARIYYVSRDEGQSYTWSSRYSATSGDIVLFLQNRNATKKLFIHTFLIGGILAAEFELIAIDSGTAGGMVISGFNLNLDSKNTAEDNAFGNAAVMGGISGTTIVSAFTTTNNSSIPANSDALILGLNDAIAIKYTAAGAGNISAAIQGYYD